MSAVTAKDNRVVLNEDEHSYINGVIRIEIKEASKIYDDDLTYNENLFVQITVRNHTKRTKVVVNTYGNPSWAQTKHFPIHIRRNKKHIDNLVTIQVIGNNNNPDDVSGDRVIGMVAFHLHDIIKQSPVDGVFDLFNRYQTVGEIKLSLSFSYGLFGYGYSSQLQDDHYTVDHFLRHSLFPRIEPLTDRQDSSKHILIPKATRHPLFISFNQRVHLGFGQQIASTLDNIKDNSGKFELVGRNMERFYGLQEEYRHRGSRVDRLNFLHNLIFDNNQKVEAIKDEPDSAGDQFTRKNTNTNLSPEELKERGLLVPASIEILATTAGVAAAGSGGSASGSGSSTGSAATSAPSAIASSPSGTNTPNNGTRSRSNSFRITPPSKDSPSLILPPSSPLSPHSLTTPLLSHQSPPASPSSVHHASPIPPAKPVVVASSLPTNPHIQRLKMDL